MSEDFNKEKLAKLLALTSSSNENEALVAIRKANELLNSSGKKWEDFLNDNSVNELAEIKPKFTQLINAYNVLKQNYNILYSQAAALAYRPQASTGYRRRSRRL
jgi:hypothetical protein